MHLTQKRDPMKIQILSDLHIDSYMRRNLPIGQIPETAADVILVAGDTANSEKGMPWLQEQAKRLQKPVITIAGNHEYFDEDVLSFDERLAKWEDYDKKMNKGLKVLQCQSVDFANIRILGCTLWTDYEYQAVAETMAAAKACMRDYQAIRAGNEAFSPEISVALHHEHRAWLKQSLMDTKAEGKTAVVMTHHSVSPLSVSQQYANLPSNAAFVSDLSTWMTQAWSPKLWLHGHTHEAFDYQQGNTRVVVNPRAYPGEVSSTDCIFKWDKVIDLELM